MKKCPHCDNTFPEYMEKCPQCGATYWDHNREFVTEPKDIRTEEEQGCLSILMFHLLIALAMAVLFVLFGFVVNLLVHFEANQVKIAWITASLLMGGFVSFIFRKLKRKTRQKGTVKVTESRKKAPPKQKSPQ